MWTILNVYKSYFKKLDKLKIMVHVAKRYNEKQLFYIVVIGT